MNSSFSTPNFDRGRCEAQTSFMNIWTGLAATFKHFELKNPTRTNLFNNRLSGVVSVSLKICEKL
ncbi:hypothetical protein HN51_054050 [Arachis hypogaea]